MYDPMGIGDYLKMDDLIGYALGKAVVGHGDSGYGGIQDMHAP
jgi:hypothetical protein